MQTWDVAVVLDAPAPDEDGMARMLQALPGSAGVGRSRDGLVHVDVTLNVPDVVSAGELAVRLAQHAVAGALGKVVPAVSLEVLSPAESDRRSEHAGELPALVSVTEAAVMLGISEAAVRLRAQQGQHGARKVGGAGWVFPRALVESRV